MKEIKIAVQGNKAALLGNIDLVAGTIGLICKFYFDDSWNGLNKTISYKVGSNELELFVDKLAAVGAATATSLEEIPIVFTSRAA